MYNDLIMNSLYAILIFLIPLATSEKWVAERDSDVVWWAEGVGVPAPIKYNGTSTESTPVLNGRSLIDSWLHPRGFVCNDPGWQVCPSRCPKE
jgi:hypothetical protein